VIGGLLNNDILAIVLFAGTGILIYLAYALICLQMIDYPIRVTLSYLLSQTLIAAIPVAILFILGAVYHISPLGMVLLGGLISLIYFFFVMRKILV
jgi:hypothetical protein